jgi:predicted transcriptional regulator
MYQMIPNHTPYDTFYAMPDFSRRCVALSPSCDVHMHNNVSPCVAYPMYSKVMPVIHVKDDTMLATAAQMVSIKRDQDMRNCIKHLADIRQHSMYCVMREAFRKENLQAWEEYQETGLHVTGEDVIAWLETLGEEDEKAVPVSDR